MKDISCLKLDMSELFVLERSFGNVLEYFKMAFKMEYFSGLARERSLCSFRLEG